MNVMRLDLNELTIMIDIVLVKQSIQNKEIICYCNEGEIFLKNDIGECVKIGDAAETVKAADSEEKWTFVSERYPDEENKEYLVLYDDDEITIEKLWFTGDKEPFFSGMNIGVVAWMPLPTRPYKEV